MKELNLDDLCPESIEVIHKGEKYLLEPLSTERLLQIVPIWEKYSDVNEKDLKSQLTLAMEFISEILPEFPADSLNKLTAIQLRAFMTAIMETMGLEEVEAEGEATKGPKEEKS